MKATTFVGMVGPAYQHPTLPIDAQRCVNWYPEIHGLGTGKEREIASLISRPGLRYWGSVGSGPIRGMHKSDRYNRAFVVSGTKLYEVSTAAVATELMTLNAASGPVQMADNGDQLALVESHSGYGFVYSLLNGGNSMITDVDFPTAPTHIGFIDGYFVVNSLNTQRFYISALYDGMVWSSLDFASKEGYPDNVVAIKVDQRRIWLAGSRTTEAWVNTGNVNFPFERDEGAFLQHGVGAPYSIQAADNAVYYLESDELGQGIVRRDTQRVSTHALEAAIRGYGDVSGTTSYVYQDGGHTFYVLNFVTAGKTWVLDISTGLWHERTYTSPTGEGRDRGEYHLFFNGKHLVGDYENGNIYELDSSYYYDNGQPLTRTRVAPHLSDHGRELFHHELFVDMETGVGPVPPLTDGAGVARAPQMMMRFSSDGARTWSNERTASIGSLGEYNARVRFLRLGMGRTRTYELKISDPIKATLISADLRVVAGRS